MQQWFQKTLATVIRRPPYHNKTNRWHHKAFFVQICDCGVEFEVSSVTGAKLTSLVCLCQCTQERRTSGCSGTRWRTPQGRPKRRPRAWLLRPPSHRSPSSMSERTAQAELDQWRHVSFTTWTELENYGIRFLSSQFSNLFFFFFLIQRHLQYLWTTFVISGILYTNKGCVKFIQAWTEVAKLDFCQTGKHWRTGHTSECQFQ